MIIGMLEISKQGDNSVRWQDLADCQYVDPEIFFPSSEDGTLEYIPEARKICFNCPVQPQCLEHSILHEERDGICGGLTESERRAILKMEDRDHLLMAKRAAVRNARKYGR